MKSIRCPICEEGSLTEQSELCEVEYHGHKAMRPSLFSTCDVCGSEQADARQTRANKRDTIEYRKQVDGLLTGNEVRALRKRWCISQTQAAQIFGGGPVAFSKYESDDVAQSEAMDKLLKLARDLPDALVYLASEAGVTLNFEGAWVTLTTDITKPKTKPSLKVIQNKAFVGADERMYA